MGASLLRARKGQEDMAKNGKAPIIIKKYANRRLYDTSISAYVTLGHLSDLVKQGAEFEVQDAKTGDDLTRSVLAQIIMEQEANGAGALPTSFLRQLIKFYGDSMHSTLPAWLDMSMNSFAERQEKWRSTMGKSFPVSPLGLFEEQAKRNMAMFEKMLDMMMPGARNDEKSDDGPQPGPDDYSDPVAIMQAQIAAMQAQLDALKKSRK